MSRTCVLVEPVLWSDGVMPAVKASECGTWTGAGRMAVRRQCRKMGSLEADGRRQSRTVRRRRRFDGELICGMVPQAACTSERTAVTIALVRASAEPTERLDTVWRRTE